MNQLHPDPLRFLKPRNRKSQLTPKKITNQSTLSLTNNQNKSKKLSGAGLNQDKPAKTQTHIFNQQQIKQKQSDQSRINKIKYNPLKYFSNSVQAHLQKLNFSNDRDAIDYQIGQTFKKQVNFIDDSFRLQQNLIIPLKHNDHNDTLNLQDYFSSSKQTPRNLKDNNNFMAMISQSPIPMKTQKYNFSNKDHQKKEQNCFIVDQQQRAADLQQDNQLCQCPTCHRKFNPTSFNKHVKVCQKVFFNKRKQFVSQKQRSLSKQKKK